MKSDYRFRRAESTADIQQLKALFTEVFYPEEVGVLAEIFSQSLPGMQMRNWFVAEHLPSGQLVSAFALIPWQWEYEGQLLKVAEMGIVGTLQAHRGQGLMRVLNKEFEQTLQAESYHLAVIQGIPGFYGQFGYSYALPLENHINLGWHQIPDAELQDGFVFRLATSADIPFLLAEDARYRAAFSVSVNRTADQWQYLLTESCKTEYGSEFWIMQALDSGERYYARIPALGFGAGLILSEISAHIRHAALLRLLAFCKQLGLERDKPYLRLNLHNDSPAGQLARALGAKPGHPYAWQIKIPDPACLLKTLKPLLERRMLASCFQGYSGQLRLDFYRQAVDLAWQDGELVSVGPAEGESDASFSLSQELFPALCLGHRSWQELQHIRPDVFPSSASSARLVETLFPPSFSWIYEQY
ncbi:MAG: GNAT family N-acetyltransferase [Anaerolineales bacterium]|nr:GNAT family N-acetyltransferase [Anaerolineales bacterium]